jgi:fatty acid desaturase
MNTQWEMLEQGIAQFKGGKVSRLMACGIAIMHISAGIVAAALSYFVFTYSLMLGMVLYFPLIFFIGTRWRAINNMSHECFHLYFTRERKWNERIGVILGIIEFGSYYDFREEHASHHRYLGDYQADGDFRGFEKFGFSQAVTPVAVWKQLLFAMSLRHLREYIFVKIYVKRDPLWAKIVRGSYIVLLIIFATFSPLVFFAYFLVPFATAYQVIKYLTDYLDHGGLLDNVDALYKSRNCYIKNPVMRSIAFPRHDCFHLVHHLFPAIPNKRMQEAHNWLVEMWPEYGQMEHGFYHKLVKLGGHAT